jgi:RNA polymerase sigma-70 factor (ECF subfamily)
MKQPPDLETVYDGHADALFHFLLSLSRNEDTVRELMQRLFLKLAQKPGLLRGVANLRSYLFRMAYHLFIDWKRAEGRWTEWNEVEEEPVACFEAGGGPDGETLRREMEKALGNLPEEQRVIVVLRLWHEWGFAEMAEMLGLPAGTVASRYRYGIDKLQAQLRLYYEDLNKP